MLHFGVVSAHQYEKSRKFIDPGFQLVSQVMVYHSLCYCFRNRYLLNGTNQPRRDPTVDNYVRG